MGPYSNGNAVNIKRHCEQHTPKGSLTGAFFLYNT